MELNLTHAVIFSEKLREKFRCTKPPMMRSRRQLFRSYPNAIVGCEIVNWIVKETLSEESQHERNNNEECDIMDEKSKNVDENVEVDLETVSRALQNLVDFGILHSIQGECPFKADSTFYRFTTDDGACSGVVEALAKGFRLHKTTLCPNCSLLQRVCEYGELISDKCMRGSDLIHWVIEHELASHQEDAKRVCQLMLDHGILKPATKQVTEFDPRLFYVFGIDFAAPSMTILEFVTITNSFLSSATDSASSLCESSDGKVNHIRQTSGQLMDLSLNEQNKTGRNKNASSSSFGSDDSGYDCDSHPGVSPVIAEPHMAFLSLLNCDGQMTPEALFHPNAPFFKKELRIYPDPVGYGFIIRGSSPCYVKIVDPESPAGKAGLKAKQYITEINSCDVTKKCHTEIEDLILNGPKFLKIIIMCPKEDCDEYIQFIRNSRKSSEAKHTLSQTQPDPCLKHTGRRQSAPVKNHTTWPSAQPWMKNSRKGSDFGTILNSPTSKIMH